MPRQRVLQNNFTAGEFSPRMTGRVNFDRYKNAVETLENYLILPHGGVKSRPGSRFVAEVSDSTKKVRLIAFEFNVSQSYICEFGNTYVRFYTQSGRLESGGSAVQVTGTPYLEADLFAIQYTQSADVMYLAHPDRAPHKLERTSATAFSITEVDFEDGPYLPENESATTIAPSATTGAGITLTASTNTFVAGHVGSLWRIKHSTTWGYAKVTGYTSATQVTADVKKDFGGTGAVTAWREGAFSTPRGYPRAVVFHEQRLWWASPAGSPQTVYGSRIADFEDHTPDAADDDAVELTIASNQMNVGQWLSSETNLLVGTAGRVVRIKGGGGEAITPSNRVVLPASTVGAAARRPISIGSATLFVPRAKNKLRELVFDFTSDTFSSPDLAILSEHITEGGIEDLAYQEDPHSTIWMPRKDGELLGLTYLRDEKIVGWARHIFGGEFSGGKAVCEAVAVIPHEDGDADQVWVSVKRTINGATKRYIEYLDDRGAVYDGAANQRLQVDSGLVYSGSAASTLTGLGHLEGETVRLVRDGAVGDTFTVTSGEITGISPTVTSAEVGLEYTGTIKVLRPEFTESIQGLPQTTGVMYILLNNSMGLVVEGESVPFRIAADPMDNPVPLFSGYKKLARAGWDDTGQITITRSLPLPSTVVAIVRVLEAGDA